MTKMPAGKTAATIASDASIAATPLDLEAPRRQAWGCVVCLKMIPEALLGDRQAEDVLLSSFPCEHGEKKPCLETARSTVPPRK